MIRHNIGVKVLETFQFKRLDGDYFSPASFKSRTAETISASSQPRRNAQEAFRKLIKFHRFAARGGIDCNGLFASQHPEA